MPGPEVLIKTAIIGASETKDSTNLANSVVVKPAEAEEIKSPPDGMIVVNSIDQLSEKTRMWLKAYPLSGFEEKKNALLEISKDTSENKPITNRLLFEMLYRKDANLSLSKANKRIDRLILAANKETRKDGFVIKSASMVIGGKEELVCWKASTENAGGSRDKIKEEEIALTVKLLMAASPINFATYRSLTIGVFGDATDTHMYHMQTIIMPQAKIQLDKLGKALIKINLKKDSREFVYSKFGFYVVEKDMVSRTVPIASSVKTAYFAPLDELTPEERAREEKKYFATTNPEKPEDNEYELLVPTINFLAKILQGPIANAVLNKFEINLTEKKQQINDIEEWSRWAKERGIQSSTDIVEGFKELKGFLKGLFGKNREKFIKQNSNKDKELGLILSAFKVEVERFDELMVDLCNAHLKYNKHPEIKSL